MNKIAALLVILACCFVILTFSQGQQNRSGASKPKTSAPRKPSVVSRSQVGLDLRFVTPDRAGGVWITGTAWFLRGLMVNDRVNGVNAIAVEGVKGVSHPIFLTQDSGWMIDTRSLYRTENAGLSWQKVKIAGGPDIRSLCFIDNHNGWVGGGKGEIYRTSDGGKTWRKQQTGLEYEIQRVFFVDRDHGWATGFKNLDNLQRVQVLMRTKDGGDTWELLSKSDPESPSSVDLVFFVSVNEGWGIDGHNNIVHTLDGGGTWRVQQRSDGHVWTCLFFVNDRQGWASGDGVIHTADGGKTWNHQLKRRNRENYLDAITFIDGNHGWAVGLDTVLRTTDGGATWFQMADDWKGMIPTFQELLKDTSPTP